MSFKKSEILKGDVTGGVRAHPSYDHPGEFYAVEANSKRRVYSGYGQVSELVAFCKSQRVTFLGVIAVTGRGSNLGYNHELASAARVTFGEVDKAKRDELRAKIAKRIAKLAAESAKSEATS